MKRYLNIYVALCILFLFSVTISSGQASKLSPGFDKNEYMELLRVMAMQADTHQGKKAIPKPLQFEMKYRSQVIGLDNRYDLWVDENKVTIISIRGTTLTEASWLADFYAAMVPASGTLHIANDFNFDYHLSDNPLAAVHTGWLLATAFIARDFLGMVDSLLSTGHSEFIIVGHSQGGAIAYLLTSHLKQLQAAEVIPDDIVLKTYCSAAPKPGNLFYAYSFERITQYGWAFHVVNSADWVPEAPISIQTLHDFTDVNPFANIKEITRRLKFPKDMVLKFVYNRLNKPTKKANRRYQKYLGNEVYKFVKRYLPGYVKPQYANTNNYVRTGSPIVLYADEEYYREYPPDKDQLFKNHFTAPYYYLTERLPDTK